MENTPRCRRVQCIKPRDLERFVQLVTRRSARTIRISASTDMNRQTHGNTSVEAQNVRQQATTIGTCQKATAARLFVAMRHLLTRKTIIRNKILELKKRHKLY